MTRYRGVKMLALALLLAGWPVATATAQEISGDWESSVWSSERSGQTRVSLSLEVTRGAPSGWNNGFSPEVSDLEGTSLAELQGDARDVEFRLRREAGTVTFRGDIRDGEGRGTFSFVADPDYRAAMSQLGYPGLSARDQYSFALFDITTERVRELAQLGYDDLPQDDLVSFAIHGVSPDFIRGMNALGYASISADDLVTMRIHGVTPAWVERIRSALRGR